MKILMIDNYDSFTYNVVHLLESFPEVDVVVRRNDELTLDEVDAFSHLVLSPGPGIPSEAGLMPDVVRRYAASKRILGVCLGHQCIGEIFGAELFNLPTPVHGKATPITVVDREEPLFQGLPDRITVGRYHSWLVRRDSIPPDLIVTAVDDGGQIMALRHSRFDVCGVQFHPESILTPDGVVMMRNWLQGAPVV